MSSPELSDSYISSAEMKRLKKKITFCVLVENINITEVIKRFRKHSIAVVNKNNDINCLRILSLSHIFPFNKFDVRKCVTGCFDNNTRKALKSVASGTKPKINHAPTRVVLYCKNRAGEGNNNNDDNNDNYDDNSEEEGKLVMMSMVKDFYLISAIQRVLLKDVSEDILYAILKKNGKKLDFMIGAKVKSKEFYFFFVDVKKSETTSKYQPEDDYTKLMKQMKGSVDDQLYYGAKNPTCPGLLIEGFKCTLFQMKLLSDGIHMSTASERFFLVEKIHQLVHLPSIVEAVYYVKVLIANKLILATVH
ncbi:uncharacterized protein BX663DRAFT_532229 [Cokeromyces recurvatus]|uniref:uncharacterized protein n=1 Tax=Cokeromyces recurvatus TaxID=90255 RepID=UPI00222029E9|nr:uncharacterized protein BX663DRAFT_532229 [Cokeromyces recurvatus]KAI7900863.1 hypothetical protein BX663DRAFT_532229 [Cokeromyces recurvatus]